MQPPVLPGSLEILAVACTEVIWEGARDVQDGVYRGSLTPPPLTSSRRSLSRMTLVSIPANPVPEDVVSGTIKTPDGAELRFARWAPPANRKGTVCVFTGRSEYIEKYFETVR